MKILRMSKLKNFNGLKYYPVSLFYENTWLSKNKWWINRTLTGYLHKFIKFSHVTKAHEWKYRCDIDI